MRVRCKRAPFLPEAVGPSTCIDSTPTSRQPVACLRLLQVNLHRAAPMSHVRGPHIKKTKARAQSTKNIVATMATVISCQHRTTQNGSWPREGHNLGVSTPSCPRRHCTSPQKLCSSPFAVPCHTTTAVAKKTKDQIPFLSPCSGSVSTYTSQHLPAIPLPVLSRKAN